MVVIYVRTGFMVDGLVLVLNRHPTLMNTRVMNVQRNPKGLRKKSFTASVDNLMTIASEWKSPFGFLSHKLIRLIPKLLLANWQTTDLYIK